MRILFVIDTFRTNSNGTSISAQRYAMAIRQRGHEVRVLCCDPEPSDDIFQLDERSIPGFNNLIHRHGYRLANSLNTKAHQVIREAVEWSDLVHCFVPFGITLAAKKMADKLGKPATVAFHIQPENITSNFGLGKCNIANKLFYWGFRKWIYSRFDYIHTPSQFMADELFAHYYVGNIRPISNGIDSSFHYRKDGRDVGLKDKIVIVMTGRLSREKRQDLLIKAVNYSAYSNRIQLVFAGKGPMEQEYKRMGEELPLPPIFVYYNCEQLQHLLAEADLYVHASDMESEAIGCIEGFAMGLVPIISNNPKSATRQFALDDRSLFEAGNPRSLANCIDYWLTHESERKRMEYRYAEYAEEFHLDKQVDKFEQMLYDAKRDFKQKSTSIRAAMFSLLFMLLIGPQALAQERVEMLPMGDLNTWTIRTIKESFLLGGEKKVIHDVANKTSIWCTSNVHARVAGIDKASCSVYAEPRGDGYCARLENKLDSITAIGVINLKVLATGTLYTGSINEPVGKEGADNPMSVIKMGIPFTGRPKALQFDYKALVSQEKIVSYAPAKTKVTRREGFDCPKVSVQLLQDGKVIASGEMLIRASQSTWQEATRLPIQWLSEEEPTHIIVQFSAGRFEPYVGHVGNILWIDNVALVY